MTYVIFFINSFKVLKIFIDITSSEGRLLGTALIIHEVRTKKIDTVENV